MYTGRLGAPTDVHWLAGRAYRCTLAGWGRLPMYTGRLGAPTDVHWPAGRAYRCTLAGWARLPMYTDWLGAPNYRCTLAGWGRLPMYTGWLGAPTDVHWPAGLFGSCSRGRENHRFFIKILLKSIDFEGRAGSGSAGDGKIIDFQ